MGSANVHRLSQAEQGERRNLKAVPPQPIDNKLVPPPNGRCDSAAPTGRASSGAKPLALVSFERRLNGTTAPLFEGLSREEYGKIVSHAQPVCVSARRMLYREGDAAESVLVLLSGWIKISRVSRSGEEVILRIKGPGEIVGSLGLAPGEVYSSAAHTLEECHLLSWDVLIFETLCERFPRLRRNVMHMQAQRLQVLEECFCDLATEQVGPRLARMILRLLEQNGGPARKTPIDLSCEELAQMTGTTLFTVSRLLCKWAELGIIQPERKMVLVEDLRGLTEIAEGVRQPA